MDWKGLAVTGFPKIDLNGLESAGLGRVLEGLALHGGVVSSVDGQGDKLLGSDVMEHVC